MENKLEKKYGLFTAICMVVGIVVGSGVFFKAQVILQKTGGDMPLGVLAWLIGGAIMIVCILAFSAMAQKYEFIFCERHFPLVRIFLFHNYFKQRRFAGTIDADNRCFFIFFNMKTYIF